MIKKFVLPLCLAVIFGVVTVQAGADALNLKIDQAKKNVTDQAQAIAACQAKGTGYRWDLNGGGQCVAICPSGCHSANVSGTYKCIMNGTGMSGVNTPCP